VSPAEELVASLTGGAAAVRELDERGRLTALIPELESGRGFAQPELHYYDVLQHNLAAVGALDEALGATEGVRELRESLVWLDLDESLDREIDGVPLLALLRLACLVHDVAKPDTATIVDGRLRFPRHGPRGAEMMQDRLVLLGFGEAATDFVARMVRYHLRPGELVRIFPPTDHAVRRFVNDLDGYVLPLMLVNLADGWATRGPRYTDEHFRRHANFVSYVVARALGAMEHALPALIHGEDLMHELGLESGRTLGAVLTSVRRAQLEGAVSDREAALALARGTLASLRAADGRDPGQVAR